MNRRCLCCWILPNFAGHIRAFVPVPSVAFDIPFQAFSHVLLFAVRRKYSRLYSAPARRIRFHRCLLKLCQGNIGHGRRPLPRRGNRSGNLRAMRAWKNPNGSSARPKLKVPGFSTALLPWKTEFFRRRKAFAHGRANQNFQIPNRLKRFARARPRDSRPMLRKRWKAVRKFW